VVKNKVAAPFKLAEFDIMFGKGVSFAGELIDHGLKNDIVAKSGSWYSYGDTRIGQGKEAARGFLNDNPDIKDEIAAKIRTKVLGLDELNGSGTPGTEAA
jgi:recombination protein RecA